MVKKSEDTDSLKYLKEYINKNYDKGYTKKAIATVLENAGWKKEVVEKEVEKIFHFKNKKKYEKWILGALGAIIFIILTRIPGYIYKSIFYVFLDYWKIIVPIIFVLVIALIALKFILPQNKKKIITPVKPVHEDDEEEDFKTTIDRVHKLIVEKKKMKISEICEHFGVEKNVAEDWVDILAGHKLIEVHYPLFGEAEVECKM